MCCRGNPQPLHRRSCSSCCVTEADSSCYKGASAKLMCCRCSLQLLHSISCSKCCVAGAASSCYILVPAANVLQEQPPAATPAGGPRVRRSGCPHPPSYPLLGLQGETGVSGYPPIIWGLYETSTHEVSYSSDIWTPSKHPAQRPL